MRDDRLMARLIRSWLYVPGNRLDRLDKARASGADALILDLEDAVPPAAKDEARRDVARLLESPADDEAAPQLWVRVNPGPDLQDDLAALGQAPGLTGVVVAKATVESTWTVAGWARLRHLRVSPLLETACALMDAREIAAVPGVLCLQIGEYDLAAELGLVPGPDESELAPYRALVVLASSARRLLPPPAPVSSEISQTDVFRASSARAARQGFLGRACIHPAQVPVVHEVCMPTDKELADAERVVAALKAAAESGDGVVIGEDGRMLDAAVVRSARLVLARARASQDR